MPETKMPPLPVLIAEEQPPIPVILEPSTAPAATVTKGLGVTLSPTTTEADDEVTRGQRHISRVWEYSQAFISVMVTGTTVYVLAVLATTGHVVADNQLLAAGQLVVMATLILTFYFARTNHVAIGGIGPKANEPPYRGR